MRPAEPNRGVWEGRPDHEGAQKFPGELATAGGGWVGANYRIRRRPIWRGEEEGGRRSSEKVRREEARVPRGRRADARRRAGEWPSRPIPAPASGGACCCRRMLHPPSANLLLLLLQPISPSTWTILRTIPDLHVAAAQMSFPAICLLPLKSHMCQANHGTISSCWPVEVGKIPLPRDGPTRRHSCKTPHNHLGWVAFHSTSIFTSNWQSIPLLPSTSSPSPIATCIIEQASWSFPVAAR